MKVGIMGCGAYGISLAVNLVKCNDITMWTALEDEKNEIISTRYNDKMLKGIYIDEKINVTTSIEEVMNNDVVIIVVPVKFIENTLSKMKNYVTNQTFVIASKGIVNGHLLNEYVEKYLNTDKIGVISGGTFAIDLANFSESGLTICGSNEIRDILRNMINLDHIKLDESSDIKGVELVASIKNTMAILMGILNKLDVTITTNCRVLTDILNDINKIIISLGGESDTILKYAGIGDTYLTCTSNKSRNFTFGELLVEDKEKAYEFLENNTVEGVNTLKEITKILENNNTQIDSIIKLNEIINNDENPKIILKK